MKYFRLDLTPIEDPKGMTTCAIRSCLCCCKILCGMGGGGEYLCEDCYHAMYSGKIRRALYFMERQIQESGMSGDANRQGIMDGMSGHPARDLT